MAQAISFIDTIAVEVGVNEAIMLSNIYHWVMSNQANERNFFDGKYWTYDTVKSYAFKYPFWTISQVRTILKNLENKGYIESGNYNKLKMDRTKWYTLTDKGFAICQNCDLHLSNLANGFVKNSKAIPHTNTHTKTNKKDILSVKPDAQAKKDLGNTQMVVDYLNEKAGTRYKATTKSTQRLVVARIKEGFTFMDFVRVIDTKCAEWLNDEKMAQYLRPETLFNASHFEGYLNQQPKKQEEVKRPVYYDEIYGTEE